MKYFIITVLVLVLATIVFNELRAEPALQVSDWKDVFDIDCSCGQHIHCEPCDLKHYKIECIKCGTIYEKDWDVSRYE